MNEEYVGYKRDLFKERAVIFAAFAISIILTATRFYIRQVDLGMMDEKDPMTLDDFKKLYSVEKKTHTDFTDRNPYDFYGGFE